MRREQDRPAPRRRRACYDDVWYFVTDPSNPQRLRCARAALEAWFNRAVTRTLFCIARSRTGPAFPPRQQARQPRIAGAVDAPPKKLVAPKAPQQHGQRESAAGSTPHCSGYRPSSGALCAGEEGLSGDTAPISYHAPLVFIKLLTVS